MTLPWLAPDNLVFPPLNSALAEPNGLLAVGGDLSPKRLLSAYQQGIFPWFNLDDPILWWSPTPRAIIELSNFRINKSLAKFLKKNPYTVTINQAFEQVIDYCADAPFRKEGTWIIDEMKTAYLQLHLLGHAHSVEVWLENKLVGGLYGVAINGFFSGESMFYLADNASKVALVHLRSLLKAQNVDFIDCQINNPFLSTMGCTELSRETFIKKQQSALKIKLPENFWSARQL